MQGSTLSQASRPAQEVKCFNYCQIYRNQGPSIKDVGIFQGVRGVSNSDVARYQKRQKLGKSGSKFRHGGGGYKKRPKKFRRLLWTVPQGFASDKKKTNLFFFINCVCHSKRSMFRVLGVKQNSYIGQYLVVRVTRLQLPAGLVTLTTNYHSTYHPGQYKNFVCLGYITLQ